MYANCNSVIVKSIVMCTQNLTFNSIITKSNFLKQTTHQSFSKLTTHCACNLGFIFDEHRITSPIRYSFGLLFSYPWIPFNHPLLHSLHNHIYVQCTCRTHSSSAVTSARPSPICIFLFASHQPAATALLDTVYITLPVESAQSFLSLPGSIYLAHLNRTPVFTLTIYHSFTLSPQPQT